MEKKLKIQLLEVLTDLFKNAQNKLNTFKNELPDDRKGFVDLQMENLKKAHLELTKDIDFYLYGDEPDDLKLKSFKIHCAQRFLPIVVMSEPKNILSYGITYREYITPNNKDR